MYYTSSELDILSKLDTGGLSKIYLLTMHESEAAYEIGKKLIKKPSHHDTTSRFFIKTDTFLFNYYKYSIADFS